MRIDRLSVKNFRCFEDAEFDFSPGFNLFVGVNGSGKSSLLRAVAASLAEPLNGYAGYRVGIHAQDENARIILHAVDGKVRYEACYPVRLEATGLIDGEHRAWWVEKSGPGRDQNNYERTISSALENIALAISQGEKAALPIAAYYAPERSWRLSQISAESAVRQKESRRNAYQNWENAAQDVKALESWVIAKTLERLESLTQSTSHANRDVSEGELDLVNRAVVQVLPGSRGLRYDITSRCLVFDWQERDPTPFDTLSDGQRSLVALVADIARRMALANPQLGRYVLEQTPGIVMIDELDIHLHPSWQRSLPSLLKTIFPLVQFVTASHSPQMMGELAPEEIWLMRGSQVLGHPPRSFGLTTNEVLEELMEGLARNPEVTAQLDTIHRHIDDDRLTEAQAALDQLRAKIGDIPEVLAAQASIDSLAWLKDEEA
ncbi:AAA family ATPase [uncultured Thiocystis sp.]|jgi:predicted ATP-binding protein involved in virulence|uniref:AAA family ATPase n=1 Tax=uncultured Thiocystis sp. TaxID=1202134 RepID=UPI0025E1831F|nr:AAA family ATPase [uncultured Thiocystis sp.]